MLSRKELRILIRVVDSRLMLSTMVSLFSVPRASTMEFISRATLRASWRVLLISSGARLRLSPSADFVRIAPQQETSRW